GVVACSRAEAVVKATILTDAHVTAEYFLTQIVAHRDMPAVERLLAEYTRRCITLPGVFGVFYYRSANPKTLTTLRQFLPVPAENLTREFADGASAELICARTIVALRKAGVRHIYVSNLPIGRARSTFDKILGLAETL